MPELRGPPEAAKFMERLVELTPKMRFATLDLPKAVLVEKNCSQALTLGSLATIFPFGACLFVLPLHL